MKNKKWKLKFYKKKEKPTIVFKKAISPYKATYVKSFNLFNRKIIINKWLTLCALKIRDSLTKHNKALAVNINIRKIKALSRNIGLTLNLLSRRRLNLVRFFGKGVKFKNKSLIHIVNHRRRLNRRNEKKLFLIQQSQYVLARSSYLVLHIKVVFNNVFCHLTDNNGRTIFPVKTGPSYGIKMSKINIKLNLERFLSAYTHDLIKNIAGKSKGPIKNFLLNITSPKKYRRRILFSCKNFVVKKFVKAQLESRSLKSKVLTTNLRNFSSAKNFLLNVGRQRRTPMAYTNLVDSKPFNGCRQIVLLRKKRMKLFFYKVR
jgi:hypothetical protein